MGEREAREELTALIAGRISTEPPYAREHPHERVPLATELLNIVLAHPETLIAALGGGQTGWLVWDNSERGMEYTASREVSSYYPHRRPVFVFPAPAERNTP